MPVATHKVGDQFKLQFVWQLPSHDYLRAIFEVEVTALDSFADRYVINLSKLVAGRQESERGEMRDREEVDDYHWGLVRELVGRQAAVAYEAADGRPLRLRLPTLTREHSYFTRFDSDND